MQSFLNQERLSYTKIPAMDILLVKQGFYLKKLKGGKFDGKTRTIST